MRGLGPHRHTSQYLVSRATTSKMLRDGTFPDHEFIRLTETPDSSSCGIILLTMTCKSSPFQRDDVSRSSQCNRWTVSTGWDEIISGSMTSISRTCRSEFDAS